MSSNEYKKTKVKTAETLVSSGSKQFFVQKTQQMKERKKKDVKAKSALYHTWAFEVCDLLLL